MSEEKTTTEPQKAPKQALSVTERAAKEAIARP